MLNTESATSNISQKFINNLRGKYKRSECLRGDFLPNRVFGAQKYRHALRENGRICWVFLNGGENP
jgi:hypothetical protein